jgi:hypothetical protein
VLEAVRELAEEQLTQASTGDVERRGAADLTRRGPALSRSSHSSVHGSGWLQWPRRGGVKWPDFASVDLVVRSCLNGWCRVRAAVVEEPSP